MWARFSLALVLAFGSLFFCLPAEADEVVRVWENDHVEVTLADGNLFSSVTAWYGSPDDSSCGADVSQVLTLLAAGQASFSVDASNQVFGDPCGGVVKILRIDSFTVLPVLTPSVEPLPPVESLPPVETVLPEPAPEPAPAPEPIPQPAPEPAPAPAPEPSSIAIEPPAVAPPSPEPVIVPPAPAEPPIAITVTPPPPLPVVTDKSIPTPHESPSIPVGDLLKLDPQTLTDNQVAQITAVAEQTLASEPQGSPAYTQALEQLFVVAQADDPQLPTELTAIPLLGNAAVAVLDAFNQLGNFGSDISPKVRKQAKKEALATLAVGTATTAASVAASGSVSYRRKVTS